MRREDGRSGGFLWEELSGSGDCPGGRLREGRCVRLKKGALAMRKDALGTCRPCKPGSVPEADFGSLSFIYDGSHLPPPATYPPASDEQPFIAGIHGLATRQTYGRRHHCRRGGLLPRLFTLTRAGTGGHSLLRFYNLTAIKSLAWTVLCVARTFLSLA